MENRSVKKRAILSFLAETAVYAGFIVAYFFLVLHFLGGWLQSIADRDKTVYAVVALALIVTQGIVLELLTTLLLKVIHRILD